jgi:hypothetical protein
MNFNYYHFWSCLIITIILFVVQYIFPQAGWAWLALGIVTGAVFGAGLMVWFVRNNLLKQGYSERAALSLMEGRR